MSMRTRPAIGLPMQLQHRAFCTFGLVGLAVSVDPPAAVLQLRQAVQVELAVGVEHGEELLRLVFGFVDSHAIRQAVEHGAALAAFQQHAVVHAGLHSSQERAVADADRCGQRGRTHFAVGLEHGHDGIEVVGGAGHVRLLRQMRARARCW
jgi:hypothetical protein